MYDDYDDSKETINIGIIGSNQERSGLGVLLELRGPTGTTTGETAGPNFGANLFAMELQWPCDSSRQHYFSIHTLSFRLISLLHLLQNSHSFQLMHCYYPKHTQRIIQA